MTKRNLTAANTAAKPRPARKAARKPVPARGTGIRSALMLSTGALALFAAAPALAQAPDVNALPTGGAFVGGAGTIHAPSGNHLQVDQTTSRGVINWNSFDIGQNASVTFDQQAGNQSLTVNRVVGSGAAPSKIFGDLSANGSIVVINGNGVVFGGTANVNVGSLIATTSNVTDANVMGGGALNFSGDATSVSDISVLGGARITVADAGLAAFVGPRVSNAGTITARGGRVVLASGVGYTLDLAGDGLLEIGVGANSPMVTQAGQVFAEGGLIQISAAAAAGLVSDVINVSGTLSVTSADLDDGVIVLSAGNGAGGAVNVVSDLTVDGDISVEARRIRGAGDINVTDGALAMALNVNGADTTGESLINTALGVVGAVDGGTSLALGSGVYGGDFTVNKGLTLEGDNTAIVTGQMIVRTGEDVTVNGLRFRLTGDQAINLEPYSASVGALMDGMTLTLNGTEFDGNGRGVWGLLMGANATINLNLNNTRFSGMQYAAYLGGDHNITSTGSIFDVGRAFSAPVNGATFDLTNNSFAGVAITVAANQRIGGLTMSGNTFSGAAEPAAAVRVSAGAASYLVADELNTPNGVVFAATNSTVANAIGAAQANDTVYLGDGTYVGNFTINKSGLILRSVNGRDATTIQGVANGDTIRIASGANNTTIGGEGHGFTIIGTDNSAPGIERAAVYFAGSNSGSNVIGNTITAGGEAGLLTEQGAGLTNLTITGNVFNGKTYVGAAPATGDQFTVPNVSRQLVVVNGGASGVVFTNNQVTGDSGLNTAVTIDSANAAITGNTFASKTGLWGSMLRARGAGLTLSGNSFDLSGLASTGSVLTLGTATATSNAAFEGYLAANGLSANGAYAETVTGSTRSLYRNIQGAVNDSGIGGTVNVLAGIYDQPLAILKSVTVQGAGAGRSIIRPTSTLATGVGHKGDANMNVAVFVSGAGNVILDGLTIDGNNLNNNAAVFWTNTSGEIRNSHITNVRPFSGAQTGHGLAVDATGANTVNLLVSNVDFDNWNKNAIDAVTGQGAMSGGGKINLTVNNGTTFTGHGDIGAIAQNGILLWERGGGTVNATLDNVSISDIGYVGDASAAGVLLYGLTNGRLAVTNSAFDDVQTYVALSAGSVKSVDLTQGNSFDGVAIADASLADLFAIEDRIDHGVDAAGNGLVTIKAGNLFVTPTAGNLTRAVGLASAGNTVNVAAGSYGDAVTINKANLTLAGAGMDATTFTNGLAITGGSAGGLTLRDFTVSGDGGSATVVRNSGTLLGLTVDGVRIDGDGVAGRHGLIGGQIGGAISIANSEFIDIRGWAAFDTRAGGGGGANVTSVNFSNNLLDGTVGHITFRQNAPVDVLINNNIVRNVGDTTDLSSGIFKVFGAGTVDFIGNSVTGIVGSPSKFTAGVADGAALIVNNTATLNITDNVFTNNQQAFLVGAGNALPTRTNVTGNTFTNNAYDIFLPASTGGTLSFGAGNTFNSGANTMAHLVWVGSTAVDMTGVTFDGKLGSAMTNAELFGLEDRIYHGVDANGSGLVTVKADNLFATPTAGNLNRAVNLASNGDTVNIANGTHNLGSTALVVDDSISLVGQSQAGTIIDGRGVGAGLGTLLVSADHVSLSNFTLYGADSGVNNFGIKVQPDPVSYSTSQRLYDFSISDVTVRGSTRAELDLNGVVGAQITNFTANGYRVGTTTETGGAGIQITDSQDIYLSGITTLGNAWGSVAIYQTNKPGAYDALTNNINIDGTNSSFAEFLGVFAESYSTLHPQMGELHLVGFDHTVRSPGHRADGQNFTYFRTTLDDAINFAANLDDITASNTSAVQGFDGSNGTGHYYVGTGDLLGGGTRNLSIQAAFDGSGTDSTVHVASGDYVETASLNGRRTVLFGDVGVTGLTLTSGAGGSTLSGQLTAGAGGLNFASQINLGGDLELTAIDGGAINLARVDGGHDLTVTGQAVTLGQVGGAQALTSLQVDGASIVTNGATTTGAQSYTGALTLNGDYSASNVTALGAVTLAGSTFLDAGDVALGTVDGGHALTIDADNSVNLGRIGGTQALASLDVEAGTIRTNGATTTGAQSYTGALTLNGDYSASNVTALGAVTLAGSTFLDASDVALGTVDGAHGLTVDAVRSVSLGRVGGTTALTGLDVEGVTIATNGATTTGSQAYAGALSLNGAYSASDVTALGAVTLAGNASVTAQNGAVRLGSVDGTSAGRQSLAIDARNNTATVGSFGSKVRLGAVTLNAAQTVLQGDTYAGNSLAFTGGAGSTVRLTRVSTTFNTSQSNGAGGDILIQPHLIGTQAGAQSVVFIAGNGLSRAGGDITLGDAGTEALRLGSMTATGDDLSAATVKLAADYTALLAGNQVFTDETLDTLGGVSARVAGNESGSIRAQGPVFLQSGGSGTGSLIAGGPVTLSYGTGTDRMITSGGDVSVSSLGGPIAGSITSAGAVTINGGSQVSTTIVAGSNVGVTTAGGISSDITAPGQVALTAGRNIGVTVDAGTVVVNAPGGTVDGVFNGISTPGNATLIVNGQAVIGDGNAASRQILTDNFLVSAGGIVGSNGQIQLPVGLAIALIAPAGEGEGQRRPIIVNDIARLGELLRLGYTAIVVQIDEGDKPAFEQELNLAEGESATPAA